MPQLIVKRHGTFHSDSIFSGVDYVVIGRAQTCDIHLPDPTHRVSRYHAAVVRWSGNAERYFIRDLGSLRSTMVFGHTISQHILREGDVIQIADYELIYSAREHPAIDSNPLRIVPHRPKHAAGIGTVQLSSYGICLHLKLTEHQQEVIESVIQAGREGMKVADILIQMMSPLAAATDARRGFACFFRGANESGFEVVTRVGMKPTEKIEITDPNYLAHLRSGRPVLDDRTILAPIFEGETPVGFICLDRAAAKQPFSSGEAEFLTMLGHLATSPSRASSSKSSRTPAVTSLFDWQCEMVGNSEAMRRLRREIREAAAGDTNVLLLGENGSGKELVARAIHAESPMSRGPFIPRNCAAVTETLAETEIFGYARRSALSGGKPEGSPGWFELAHGGTLLLDEIQGLTIALQDKFLRVLQDKEVLRAQARSGTPVQVKVIAATDQDLQQAIKADKFRKPFYFRFGQVIKLPPLRERKEDIPLLTFYFLDKYASKQHSPVRTVSYRALQALQAYDWPGNIRELENSIRSALAKALDRDYLFSWDFPTEITAPVILDSESPPPREQMSSEGATTGRAFSLERRAKPMTEVEKEKITEALEATRGNINHAVKLLGYRSRQTMLNKMDRYSIARNYGDPGTLDA